MGRAIWLVGMMGAGKSAVGPLLADWLGRAFADSDREVERRAGCSVAEIFDGEGEAAFRAREREAIEALAEAGGVVALGGGAIAQPGIAERLAETGHVVYLRARIETLLERIGDAQSRPLLRDLAPDEQKDRLASLLAQREAAYASAAIVVDTDELAPSAVAEIVASRLRTLDESNERGELGASAGEGGPVGDPRETTGRA